MTGMAAGRLRTVQAAPDVLPRLLICAAVLAAFALRLYRIGGQSLWYDEAYSVWLTYGDVPSVVGQIIAVDNHPPLFTLLLKMAMDLAGGSELAVRFVSVLAGTLATAAIARLAGRLGGWPLAAVAAWLAALSPFYLLYGQEARGYALLLLVGALILDTALRCLRTERLRPWAELGVLALLALYTHYAAALMLVGVAALATVSLLRAWRRRSLTPLIGGVLAGGIAGLGYLPWLQFALQALRRDKSYYEGSLALLPVLNGLWTGFAGAIDQDGAPHLQLVSYAVMLVLLALVGGMLRVWDQNRDRGRWVTLVIVLVLPVAGYAVLQQLIPKFHPRYLISLTPAFYVLAGAGLLSLWRWRQYPLAGPALAIAAAAIVAAGWVPLLQRYYAGELGLRQDWRGVSQALAAERGPNEPVVVLAGYGQLALHHYLPSEAVIALPDAPLPRLNQTVGVRDLEALQAKLEGADRFWLVEWQAAVMDPAGQLEQALLHASRLLSDRDFRGVRLRSVALNGNPLVPPSMGEGLAANFAGLISLEAVQLPAVPVPSSTSVPIRLLWRTQREPQRNYKMALRLLDQQQQEWGRLDARPAGELNITRRWLPGADFSVEVALPIKPGTPPGDYTVELQLYDEETLAQVPGSVGLRPSSPLVTVGSVRIAGAPIPLAALGPLTPAQAEGDGLRLIGFRAPATPTAAGDAIPLTLAWEVTGTREPNSRVRLDALGVSVSAPVLPSVALGLARPGDRFLTMHALPTPPEAGGPAQVTVSVDGLVAFGLPTTVTGRPRAYSPPAVSTVAQAPFGDRIELYGFIWDGAPVRPGAAIPLKLIWRPLTRPQVRLKVFVHMVDSSGFPVAQHDSEPVNNTLPTLRWSAGEFVEDLHAVRLPADMPPGTYQLLAGLYLWPDGARLPVQGEDAYRIPIPVTVERR